MREFNELSIIEKKFKMIKKPHSIVIFLIKVRRSYRDLTSQADSARDN